MKTAAVRLSAKLLITIQSVTRVSLRSSRPADTAHWVCRGYVSVRSGWIAQVRPDPALLRLEAPVALDEDYAPITGRCARR